MGFFTKELVRGKDEQAELAETPAMTKFWALYDKSQAEGKKKSPSSALLDGWDREYLELTKVAAEVPGLYDEFSRELPGLRDTLSDEKLRLMSIDRALARKSVFPLAQERLAQMKQDCEASISSLIVRIREIEGELEGLAGLQG